MKHVLYITRYATRIYKEKAGLSRLFKHVIIGRMENDEREETADRHRQF